MYPFAQLLFLLVACYVAFHIFRHRQIAARRKRLDSYQFPAGIALKVRERYPHLSEADVELVIQGMREYFQVCNIAGRKVVAMPSQVVDAAWHEFILFTREYKKFCSKTLGRFLHHTPAEAMQSPTVAQKGIKTAWRISCARQSIAPRAPKELPVLFSIDAALKIPDGFEYSLNCKSRGNTAYCASHIGCGSGCSGDSSGCTSCSSGCGGD